MWTIFLTAEVIAAGFFISLDKREQHSNVLPFKGGSLSSRSWVNDFLTREDVRSFLKFVHDDTVYCKYYEVVYILFHTGMRISEFCGLALDDVDMEKCIININHQL